MKKLTYLFLVLVFLCLNVRAWELKSTLIVKGKNVYLKDIFENIKDDKIKNIRVTSAPMPGREKRISVKFLNQILLKNGLPPFKYEKNYIKVKTYKFGLTSEIICDYLRKNYNLSFPFLIGYDVKYLPSDKFKIKSEKFGNDAFLISVLIDGEIYKKFIVRYKERTLKRVLVAKYFIKSGSKITGDDFVYMQVLMPPSEKTVSGKEKLKYCFAARDIAKGEVLLSRYVKYADIIISGSVVEAVYSGNGFTMTLKLQALQNGKYGQIIKLKDLKNNRIYRGRVKSENEVELII